MCGRDVAHSPLKRIMEAFHLKRSSLKISVIYNIAPAQSVPVIINRQEEWLKPEALAPRVLRGILKACPVYSATKGGLV